MNIRLGTIPQADYGNYRLDVMFDGYKWDLQVGKQSTISDRVVLLDRETMDFLAESAVSLYRETIAMEKALKSRCDLLIKTGISERMANALCNCDYQPQEHIRFMRFDYHPTTNGWRISEVNSDVPAGYPEASVLPKLAAKYFPGYTHCGDFGETIADRFCALAPQGSTIAYLHDTHTVEDYQCLHFIGDLMEKRGYRSLYIDPSYLKWENIGAVMRYYPVEWLEFKNLDWHRFLNTKIPSCNHPVALLTQSKRLPLVWNELDVDIPYWKRLLPKTFCPSENNGSVILKPAFGRVGEGINIPGTMSDEENRAVIKAAKENPLQWAAQSMFESLPVEGLHLNLGVFAADGKFAGLYGRISSLPRIDSEASEVPVLVEEENYGQERTV